MKSFFDGLRRRRGRLLILFCAVLIPSGACGAVGTSKLYPVGSVQIDYAAFDKASDGDGADNFSLRRLRLGAVGRFAGDWKVKTVLDIDEEFDVSFTDAYLRWRSSDEALQIVAGQHRTPNSLDEQTSSRRLSTLERAAFTDAFGFGRRIGVSVKRSDDDFFVTAGAYGSDIDGDDDQAGYAFAARGVFHPKLTDKAQLHFGASMRFRRLGDDAERFRYEQRAYARVSDPVMSVSAMGRSDVFFGAEAAYIGNRFWTAAEYGVLRVRTDEMNPDRARSHFHGGYVEFGKVLGGRRLYKSGRFGKVDIDRSVSEGGRGALSLVLRYDALHLDADAGGRYHAWIAGANWHVAKGVTLSANLFATRTTSHAAFIERGDAAHRRGVLIRAQYGF